MFEQDYVMRMIREMVRSILKLVFHIDTDPAAADLFDTQEDRELFERLMGLVEQGKIAEAEELVRILGRDGSNGSLKLTLLFYSALNEKPDAFLEANGFSREQIKAGLKQTAERFSLEDITNLFLT